jgi:predicted component of type VI protein secretion system
VLFTLVSAGGDVLHFPPSADNTWSVGREDPVTGVHPDIDLTSFDPERTVSRRHAQISLHGGQPLLSSVSATNWTRVNGMTLATGQAVPLVTGDRIEFGRCVVIFR